MDDIGKAVIMVGQILLFITASSVSIFLYNSLIDKAENTMIANTNNNRGDAIVNVENMETRDVSNEEIILAILDLKEKSSNNKVIVDGVQYRYESGDNTIRIGSTTWDFDSSNLRSRLLNDISNEPYEMSNYSSSTILEYTQK